MTQGFSRRTVMGLAAALSAALPGYRRSIAQPVSAQVPPSAGFKRAYADGPYGQIHYRFAGTENTGKTPLLCLHPSPLSGIVYDKWVPEMGRDRFTMAPDTPGYGGSDTPPAKPEITDYAAAMWRFCDSMGLKTVDLMGYHTGSLISVAMTCQQPDRVRRVVLISAPLPDEKEVAQYSTMINAPPETFQGMLSSTLDRIRKVGRGLFRDVTDERYWDITLERMRHYRTSAWGFRAAFNYNLALGLPEVAQPILILNPQDDLWDETPKAKAYLKNGEIHNLPGWTHGHLELHTEEMAAIVREFLDRAA